MSLPEWKHTVLAPGLEAWTLRTPNVKIAVTRSDGAYKGWRYSCSEVGADETPLRAEAIEDAKLEAATAVWQQLERALVDLDAVVVAGKPT